MDAEILFPSMVTNPSLLEILVRACMRTALVCRRGKLEH